MEHPIKAGLGPPKDLSHHISRTTRARPASSIKRFYKYFQIPGIGQFAGGLPDPNYFPYDTLEAQVALPDRWKPTPNDPIDPPEDGNVFSTHTLRSSLPASRVLVPKESGNVNPIQKIDLTSALQYGQAQGYPPLYAFIREFTREVLQVDVPYKDGPEIILTCGSTDGFSKAIQAFNNEWSAEKDPLCDKEGLIVEKYAYMNAIQAATPRGMNLAAVEMDDEGMLAKGKGGLQDVLENWDFSKGKRPHLMYTVTMGQNPTSGVLSLVRKRELYALCQKYDIIIIEDDPYWYLQYPSAVAANMASGRTTTSPLPQSADLAKKKSSGFPFIDSLVPSFLHLDVDGRVVRLDTFSKTIAPGCRLGWITAQPRFIERFQRIAETTTQQPSGFVQSMVAELLIGPQGKADPGVGGGKDGKGWDVAGWVRWLEGLRGNYERRMNVMCRILEKGKYVVKDDRRRFTRSTVDDPDEHWVVVEKTQLYDFIWPVGGMFLWLKALYESHPLFDKVGGPRLAQAQFVHWTKKPFLVLAGPGAIFGPTEEITQQSAWKYFRFCFAACEEEMVEPLTQRLADGFQAFWKIEDVKVIDALLAEDDSDEDTAAVVNFMGPC